MTGKEIYALRDKLIVVENKWICTDGKEFYNSLLGALNHQKDLDDISNINSKNLQQRQS